MLFRSLLVIFKFSIQKFIISSLSYFFASDLVLLRVLETSTGLGIGGAVEGFLSLLFFQVCIRSRRWIGVFLDSSRLQWEMWV